MWQKIGRTVPKGPSNWDDPYEETLHNPSMLYLGSRVLGGVFLTAVQPEMPG